MIYLDKDKINLKEYTFSNLEIYDNYLDYIKESHEIFGETILQEFNTVIQESESQNDNWFKKFINKIKELIKKFFKLVRKITI